MDQRTRKKSREAYLSTGMVNVGCATAAIAGYFGNVVSETGTCQKKWLLGRSDNRFSSKNFTKGPKAERACVSSNSSKFE